MTPKILIKSSQIIYSDHGYDECFVYKDKHERVPDGIAIGYEAKSYIDEKNFKTTLFLFDDIDYSEYDHDYWDNYELEHDIDRIILP